MLSDSLGIKMGLTAIIGGGGKTTLMLCLGRELSKHGRVIITTSAKIYPPENITTLDSPSENDIRKALSAEKYDMRRKYGAKRQADAPGHTV